MKDIIYIFIYIVVVTAIGSCDKVQEHTAPAIRERDSVAMMTSYGVNTLISDSGVIKYRIVTERWEINQNRNPSRWIFDKGIFLEQFDEKFHVHSYIQCDTAYYFDKDKLWELRGRVKILTQDGLKFSSEELYWNEADHELYSNKYSILETPERTLQGTYFKSDEKMTKYVVANSKGAFSREDMESEKDSILSSPDSVKSMWRLRQAPKPKVNTIPIMH